MQYVYASVFVCVSARSICHSPPNINMAPGKTPWPLTVHTFSVNCSAYSVLKEDMVWIQQKTIVVKGCPLCSFYVHSLSAVFSDIGFIVAYVLSWKLLHLCLFFFFFFSMFSGLSEWH